MKILIHKRKHEITQSVFCSVSIRTISTYIEKLQKNGIKK